MLAKGIAWLASVLGRRSGPRPNVLWICADDFTPDACGAYGNPLARTPCLDRLASQGIRFDRAFCTSPLSTPSRQSFWTGRYPRSIGVTLSPTPLPENEVTLPTLLRGAGYEVTAFGKTHYYWPRRHEFDTCVDWNDYEILHANAADRVPAGVPVFGPWRPFRDPARVWLNSDCLPQPSLDADMYGTFLASLAVRYLTAEKARPFFLYVSFHETHAPFAFPVEFRGRHDPRAFPVPPMGPGDWERLPRVFRGLTEADKQGILAAYATSAEFMDRNVGTILEALDRSPHAGNTLVLFTSDHGYLLGQHGRFEKHCCFDPAVRATLLMRLPGQVLRGGAPPHPASALGALVELHDLMPTILELCGVTIPKNLHGRSLVPLLRGRTEKHRERVFAEYADNEEAMIRTDRWKLIYETGARRRRDGYALDPPSTLPSIQLYDLENDPGEMINLVGRPDQASRVDGLLDELTTHLVRTAREPAAIPKTRDRRVLLAHCLPPPDDDLAGFLQKSRRPGG